MKLTRLLPLVLICNCIISPTVTNVLKENVANGATWSQRDPKTKKQDTDCVHTWGSKVTILLHGLMVGYYKKNDIFEIGTVKRAPDHKSSLTVSASSECPEHPYPSAEIALDRKTTYRFELKKGNKIKDPDIKKWDPTQGPYCGDTGRLQKLQDAKYILNMDDLHGSGHVKRYKKPFDKIFYFRNGRIMTKCLTRPISAVQVESEEPQTPTPPKNLAEVVQVQICLESDESLALINEKTNDVLWEHVYCGNGGTEATLLNLRPEHDDEEYGPHSECCVCPPKSQIKFSKSLDDLFEVVFDAANMGSTLQSDPIPTTDFQMYYYLVFKKDIPDRYELIGPSDCYVYKERAPGGEVCIVTVPPYRCGMLLVKDSLGKVGK